MTNPTITLDRAALEAHLKAQTMANLQTILLLRTMVRAVITGHETDEHDELWSILMEVEAVANLAISDMENRQAHLSLAALAFCEKGGKSDETL